MDELAEYYPVEIFETAMEPAISAPDDEVFASIVNVGIVTPGGTSVEIRGDITRVGHLPDGEVAFDIIEEACCDAILTIPMAWVDYWYAECWRDWPRELPTQGEKKELRFVLSEPLELLAAQSGAKRSPDRDLV